MTDVSPRVAKTILRAAENAGIDTTAASYESRSYLIRNRRIPWSTWGATMEILDEAAGGGDGLSKICESMPSTVPRSVAATLGLAVSTRTVYRMFVEGYGPSIYTCVKASQRDGGDGKLVIALELDDGYRECEAFFRASIGALSGVPQYLGLPCAAVDAAVDATVDGRRGEYEIAVRDPPLYTRLGLPTLAHPIAELVMGELRAALKDAAFAYEDLRRRYTVPATRGAARVRAQLPAAESAWALTPRQTEVLGCLAEGLSTRDIARCLACSPRTVDAHVGELLRKADADSRLELVASFWLDL